MYIETFCYPFYLPGHTLQLLSYYFLLSELEIYSAYGIAFLMLIAILMHIKIGDPIKKSLPAFIFLSLSLIVALVQ